MRLSLKFISLPYVIFAFLLIVIIIMLSLGYIQEKKNLSNSENKKEELHTDFRKRSVTMQINAIPFSAQFEVVEGKLRISYKLQNTTEGDIYVFNNLFKWDRFGNQIRDSNLVYISHTEDNFIHLSKQVSPIPLDRDVPIREIPFVTKVGVGKILEESILINLPLIEYNPYYFEKENSEYKKIVCDGVFLSIGFVRSYDELEVVPLPDAPEIFRIQGPYLLQKTELVISEKQHIPLELKRRTDKFERF